MLWRWLMIKAERLLKEAQANLELVAETGYSLNLGEILVLFLFWVLVLVSPIVGLVSWVPW